MLYTPVSLLITTNKSNDNKWLNLIKLYTCIAIKITAENAVGGLNIWYGNGNRGT